MPVDTQRRRPVEVALAAALAGRTGPRRRQKFVTPGDQERHPHAMRHGSHTDTDRQHRFVPVGPDNHHARSVTPHPQVETAQEAPRVTVRKVEQRPLSDPQAIELPVIEEAPAPRGVETDGKRVTADHAAGAGTRLKKLLGKAGAPDAPAQTGGTPARGDIQDPTPVTATGSGRGGAKEPPIGASGASEDPLPRDWEEFLRRGQLNHRELQDMLSAVGPEFTRRGVTEREYTEIIARAGVFLQRVAAE